MNNQKLVSQMNSGVLRIIDGDEVAGNDYDYVVLLAAIYDGQVQRQCTASLLSSKWGLTAAHCLESYLHPEGLKFLYIWYCNFTISPVHTKFYSKVLELFIHPHYLFSHNNHKIELNDIALVRVKDVFLVNYGKLLATDYQAVLGHEVTSIGGGQMEQNEKFSLQDELRPLQYFKGVVITCDKSYLDKISYPLICVASKCSRKTQMGHYGDSGGPLIHGSKIIGILVTVTPSHITAYVPLSPYLHWIWYVINTKSSDGSHNNTDHL
ncbi:unnamed protein product [Arctia plantaginis]|uniref:Peptidase S1 domain-containing protein n=1 Tax=Arctia plantaginis TaxID=874455 RepID=A0A8S0Z3W2_ARCPL|nr:unnamed protein product [Arctia plantaginis]